MAQLVQTLWGKLLFLSFHLTALCLVLVLTWSVDNYIEIDVKKWVKVENDSKYIFALASALPTLCLLVIIDLELFGFMPQKWKLRIFLMIFTFSVVLFVSSILVVQNRTILDYAPVACDGRVRCKHLSMVYTVGFVTSIILLLTAIALARDIFMLKENLHPRV